MKDLQVTISKDEHCEYGSIPVCIAGDDFYFITKLEIWNNPYQQQHIKSMLTNYPAKRIKSEGDLLIQYGQLTLI